MTEENTFNGKTNLVRLSRGEISQNKYAELEGVPKSTLSKDIRGILLNGVKYFANRYEQVLNELEQLRTLRERDVDSHEQLARDYERLANSYEQLTKTAEQLKVELDKANDRLGVLANEKRILLNGYEQLKSKYDKWLGEIMPIRVFKTKWVVFTLSILVALLDLHVFQGLLSQKVGWFSWPIGIGLAFVLVTFTINSNRTGRELAIWLTFIAAGLYFDALGALSNIANSTSNWMLPQNGDLVSIALTVFVPWINKILSKMLED